MSFYAVRRCTTESLGLADFLKLKKAFGEMRGVTLLKLAWKDASWTSKVTSLIASLLTVLGIGGGIFSALNGHTIGIFCFVFAEVVGAAWTGNTFVKLVRNHWIKQLGLKTNLKIEWDELEANRLAQLLPDDLKNKDVRKELLELIRLETRTKVSTIGIQPFVLASVGVLVALINAWATQPIVWSTGFGYFAMFAVVAALVFVSSTPEIIMSTQKERDRLEALVRWMPLTVRTPQTVNLTEKLPSQVDHV